MKYTKGSTKSPKPQGKTPNEVYSMITQKIIEELEQGIVPWHKPWKASDVPRSFSTGKPYQGINLLYLATTARLMNYESPFWITYKNAIKQGGYVKRGEHAIPVVYWKKVVKEDEDGEKKFYSFLKYDNVYNLDQTEGVKNVPCIGQVVINNPIEECEKIVLGFKNQPNTEHGGDRAYYNSNFDKIVLPKLNSFDSAENYYCTRFHEMIHSTGHASRLNRKSIVDACKFGDTNYSEEELIAEIGAAYLCGCAGIENLVVNNSVAYIANWLTKLRNDKQFIVKASSKAQRAANFVLDIKEESKQEDDLLEEKAA
jgi:antirestriction protein ArdC